MKCAECKKEFQKGNRPDGLPNGACFVLENGTTVTVCTECIIKKGKSSNATDHILNKYYGREDPDEHMG